MKKALAIIAAVLLVAAAGLAALWFFVIKSDPKPKPQIVETPITEDGSTTTTGAAPPDGQPDGTWQVTPGVGETDDERSFVGYRVQENLRAVDQTTTGRTAAVTGTLVLSGEEVTEVDVTADLTRLESNQAMRDNSIRSDGLQTDEFPQGTFSLTEPIRLPGAPEAGTTVDAEAKGELTLHGETNEVTIPLEARWDGTHIQVTGTVPIEFTDYGITPPNRAGIVTVEPRGEIDINLWFEQQ